MLKKAAGAAVSVITIMVCVDLIKSTQTYHDVKYKVETSKPAKWVKENITNPIKKVLY